VPSRPPARRRPLVVAALGGNALLRRGQSPTLEAQRENARHAAEALAALAGRVDLVVTHGSGPQVGRLAEASERATTTPDPLDVVDAEVAGMLGQVIELALRNAMPSHSVIVLLTVVLVAADDPAFGRPSKPVGLRHDRATASRLAAERGWEIAPDGDGWRRVVASPEPVDVLEVETVGRLVEDGAIVVCAGGGGIPVARGEDGSLRGVEAVVDKDLVSAHIATRLQADALLLLTDVAAVQRHFGTPAARDVPAIDARDVDPSAYPAGSMRPKLEAARRYTLATGGRAVIGALEAAEALFDGRAGTTVALDPRAAP
jgi:carbamate kinase